MKPLLILSLLFVVLTAAPAQDFRALPPLEQPNAAELAYFGGKHSDYQPVETADSTNIKLVLGFLNNLSNTQLEAAHAQLTEDFKAYGPGYADFLEKKDLLEQWDRNGRLFTDQRFDIEATRLTRVADGNRQGIWVYVKGVWSGNDSRRGGLRIRVPFHTLARLSGGRIERTNTSYGTDQLFYDLGFPLYSTRSELTQKR